MTPPPTLSLLPPVTRKRQPRLSDTQHAILKQLVLDQKESNNKQAVRPIIPAERGAKVLQKRQPAVSRTQITELQKLIRAQQASNAK